MGTTLRVGQIYADYRIEGVLGEGGMGEVYLARDPNLDRSVALKLLTNARLSAGPELRQRFELEADLIARLQHPNIITVHSRGEAEGHLWIAMAHISGQDLRHAISRGPLEVERAVNIVTQTATALDFAYEQSRILHRDIKPGNILLSATSPEHVVLTDFGIAKALSKTTQLTMTSQYLGTPAYSAPELFVPPYAGTRLTDVYALGVMLYQMLTGELPFDAATLPALAYEHVHGAIPRPTAKNPSVPKALDEVLAVALAKEPGSRYPTGRALATASQNALVSPSAVTERPTPPRVIKGTSGQGAGQPVRGAYSAARRLGVDLSKVKGSRPDGRITAQDVYDYHDHLTAEESTSGEAKEKAPYRRRRRRPGDPPALEDIIFCYVAGIALQIAAVVTIRQHGDIEAVVGFAALGTFTFLSGANMMRKRRRPPAESDHDTSPHEK